jgi:hypothetical protein
MDIIEKNSDSGSESEYENNLEEKNECLCNEKDDKETYMEFVKKLDKNSWDERTIQFAVDNGEWECVKYLYENGCPFNKDTIISTGVDNLEMLKYLHGIGGRLKNMHVITARLSDNYEIFEYLLDNGCEFDIELAKFYGIIFTKEDEGEEYIDDKEEMYKRIRVYDNI